MMTSMRIDDDLKKDCDAVFKDLGLSMTSAVTLFLQQVRKQRAIPFIISCNPQLPVGYADRQEFDLCCKKTNRSSSRGRVSLSGLRARGRIAERYFQEMRDANDHEWTLDEINAEIAASRRERHARSGV